MATVAGSALWKPTVNLAECGYSTFVGEALNESVSTPSAAEATEAAMNADAIAKPIQIKILFRI
jgi:hypothetical protein